MMTESGIKAGESALENKMRMIGIYEGIIADELGEDFHAAAEDDDFELKASRTWDRYGTGNYKNLDQILLRWRSRRIMEFIPDPTARFSFVDSLGVEVRPERFYTDGATIPPIGVGLSGISRWDYGPAVLLHDWEYSLHHCDRLPDLRTQENVDTTMFEAIKTLMVNGVVPVSKRKFWKIHVAIKAVAHRYWNADTPCSIPIDD